MDEIVAMKSSSCPSDLFARIKEKQCHSYSNDHLFSQPYYKCILASASCLEEPRWTLTEKFSALKPASYQDFTSFASFFLRQVKIEVLIHGNYTQEDSLLLIKSIVTKLDCAPLPLSQEPIRRQVLLERGVNYLHRLDCKEFNPEELNSAIESHYLIGNEMGCSDINEEKEKAYFHLEALLHLTAHLVSEPCFDILRSKEQLGYIVNASKAKVGSILTLRFIIQSNSQDPAYLDDRVELFIASYRLLLVALTEEEFSTNIQAVVEHLLERPKNLNQVVVLSDYSYLL